MRRSFSCLCRAASDFFRTTGLGHQTSTSGRAPLLRRRPRRAGMLLIAVGQGLAMRHLTGALASGTQVGHNQPLATVGYGAAHLGRAR